MWADKLGAIFESDIGAPMDQEDSQINDQEAVMATTTPEARCGLADESLRGYVEVMFLAMQEAKIWSPPGPVEQ